MNTKNIFRQSKISFSILSFLALSTISADATPVPKEQKGNVAIKDNKPEDMLTIHAGETTHIDNQVNNITISDGHLNIHPGGLVRGNIEAYGAHAQVYLNGSTIEGNVILHSLDDDVFYPLTRTLNIQDANITGNSHNSAITVKESSVFINNSRIENHTGTGITLIKPTVNGMSSPSTGRFYGSDSYMNHSSITDAKNSIAVLRNSTVSSNSNGAYITDGNMHIFNSKINSASYSGMIFNGGELVVSGDSGIYGNNSHPGLTLVNEQAGKYISNHVIIDNSTVYSKYNAAIAIYSSDPNENDDIDFDNYSMNDAWVDIDEESLNSFISYYSNDTESDNSEETASEYSDDTTSEHLDSSTTIILRNNARVISDNHFVAHSMSHLPVSMQLTDSTISGCIKSDPGAEFSLHLDQNAAFDGYAKNITNIDLAPHSVWQMTQNSDVENINNAGDILLSEGNSAVNELLIRNSYTGNHGLLTFNVKLADDTSISDKLTILGDTSGITTVRINNIGGTGDATVNGIEIISVRGLSDGIFKQSGRIVAGAYDYSLVRGKESLSKNWYLTSQPSAAQTVLTDTLTGLTDAHIEHPEAEMYTLRPEAASYITNLNTANRLFLTTMNDRAAKTQYRDSVTGEKRMSSLWLRQLGNHNSWHDSDDQLKTKSTSYVTLLGGDIGEWSPDSVNRVRLGLMAGYGKSQSKTRSSVTHYHSKGSISGYSIGAYGTWFTNDNNKTGLYVDSWLQYNWFNNQVNGQELTKEHYKSEGINASVEAGYTLKMANLDDKKKGQKHIITQAHSQATLMNVKAKDHREINNTRVSSSGQANIQTRLGVRAYLESSHGTDKDKRHGFEPFIETNWLHNTRNFSATMDGNRITLAGDRNIGEIKIGMSGDISSNIHLTGNISTQTGDKGYNNTSLSLGAKYNF
ncbi:autotransporter outer membrane beta-barrel domain-containing protein [Citrobacter sp. JGM124]|uniref:autotransporter outer membrane beta-barrel domain-containing protein n=1 Tax=Citrobacter sp. JGM124 TaxID=2799789 RepID=UPI001BA6CB4F|nr:autotransporter outer membrane beta-barrel domain-containing protein [Citrobacter sp. JGM124]MBS0847516.1 autotransporter outer membrane beta-barrel domain-containing protein [Citrobacter sp. JGM124]